MDDNTRKQQLLTRIAVERAAWALELDSVRQQLVPARLMSAALRGAVGERWWTSLFGRRGPAVPSLPGWAAPLVHGLMLVRRHPVAWSLIGGVLPWLRRRRTARLAPRQRPWLRIAAASALGGAALAGWLTLRLRLRLRRR